MKRALFLSMILILGLGLLIAGCKGKDDMGDGGKDGELITVGETTPPSANKCAAGELCLETEDNDVACQDGEDNDGDGAIDCDDTDCASNSAVTVCVVAENTYGRCHDGIDNDRVGGFDCGGDANCTPSVCSGVIYENTAALCGNTIDDDGDTLIDCADPNCSGLAGCPVMACMGPGCHIEETPEIEITSSLSGVETRMDSQLYGIAIPEGQQPNFTAEGWQGPLVWELQRLVWNINSIDSIDMFRPPAGLQITPVSSDNEGKIETVKITGTPRDRLGRYTFKIKVTDTATNQSAERIIKLNLADDIVIDVYRVAKGQWQLMPSTSTGDFRDNNDRDYAGITTVNSDKGFTVPANTVLKLVARGRDTARFDWCIWYGTDVCNNAEDSPTDIENRRLKLTIQPPQGTEDPSSESKVAKTANTPTSVRYLSAKRDFSDGFAKGVTPENYVHVDDNYGNREELKFNFIDFECHGELFNPGLQTIELIGNVGKHVKTRLSATGGSEGTHYKWTLIEKQVENEVDEDDLLIGIIGNQSVENMEWNEVHVTFQIPSLFTLKKYLKILRKRPLATATVKVEDEVCRGSREFKINYSADDSKRDVNGDETEDNNYLNPLVKDIKVKLKFENEDNVIQETSDGAMMKVRFIANDVNGNGLVALASYDLHTCNVENDLTTCEEEKGVTFYENFASQEDTFRFRDIGDSDIKFDSPGEWYDECQLDDGAWGVFGDCDDGLHLEVHLDSITITAGKPEDGSNKPYWKIYMNHGYLERHGIHGGVVGGDNKFMQYDILGGSLNNNWVLTVP